MPSSTTEPAPRSRKISPAERLSSARSVVKSTRRWMFLPMVNNEISCGGGTASRNPCMPSRSAFSAFISTIRSPLSIMKAIFIGAIGSTETIPASL